MSLDWKSGVLVVSSFLCILLFSAVIVCKTISNSDRTNLFLPVTLFDLDPLLVCDRKSVSRLSRIKNKGISALLMISTVIAEVLVIKKILPVSSQDVW